VSERYVVAGLGRARAEWFARVSGWATAAAIPVEFVRCVSGAELRARLTSGRPFSAILVEGGVTGVDRDLLLLAREVGAAAVVVATEGARDWVELGAASILPEGFGREDLLETLAAVAEPVSAVATTVDEPTAGADHQGTRGRLVAVTGAGGVGTSTVAIALAQGLAAGAGSPDDVLLADLCRVADQAMLHDSKVVVPGVQELVETHRTLTPGRAAVQELTFRVPSRCYRLLLGLRRPRHWVALRPRALEAALSSLTRTFHTVVADVEPELDGEAETGSIDLEERNLAARLVVGRADAVVVVGEPSMKGVFAQVRVIADLLAFGVPQDRVVPVVNRGPRRSRQRAELTRTIAGLLETQAAGAGLASPVFLPDRRVEQALRDGVALPDPLPTTLAKAVEAVVSRAAATDAPSSLPVPVAPGSLGALAGHDDEEDIA
jgi:MinD-like ATPase involved in chromosome partitioning or flagellar assembly